MYYPSSVVYSPAGALVSSYPAWGYGGLGVGTAALYNRMRWGYGVGYPYYSPYSYMAGTYW
ncbi:hypothetical protein Q5752_000893 [Cryptotrichosporon argae]